MKQTILHLLLLTAIVLGSSLPLRAQNHNFRVAKNLDIFNTLYRDLDLYYVDTLDADKNIDAAANYMLQRLDPYTEYYTHENSSDLREMTTGKYSGIGAHTPYRKQYSRCAVAYTIQDMPADRAGLQTGDLILAIDGQDIEPCRATTQSEQNKYAEHIRDLLRGDAGTTVQIKVRRLPSNKTYTYHITRETIVQPSVTLAAIVTDSIGYISLGQFIEGTAAEVRRAMVDLKQRGARSLILDLRSNPGGLLDEAVKTVNLFIPYGREVVSTRGKVKELNETYKTTLDAQDPDIPLVVLTNEYSASAAEITAGVLQDYDRALIMGRRTYGKGLVQQSRELPYNAVLKLTTGKYYTPSGRCVQAYTFKDGRPVHLPDSLSHEYRTANGRTVRDGGGITPDITLAVDSMPNLLIYLENSDQLFDYLLYFRSNHPTIAPAKDFRLTPVEYADFCAFMKKQGFTYDRESIRILNLLRQAAAFEGYTAQVSAQLDTLERHLSHNQDYDFQHWEPQIRRIVEAAIIETYHHTTGREEYELLADPDVWQAVERLHHPREIQKLLSGEPEA